MIALAYPAALYSYFAYLQALKNSREFQKETTAVQTSNFAWLMQILNFHEEIYAPICAQFIFLYVIMFPSCFIIHTVALCMMDLPYALH